MKNNFFVLFIALALSTVQFANADTYILNDSTVTNPQIADDGENAAIVSTGSAISYVYGTMNVLGDSTINNTNRLELQAAISADAPYTITKVGSGMLLFMNDSSAVGKIVITAGQVVGQNNVNSLNAINGVDLNGGTLQIWNLQNVTGHIYANGGTFQSAGGNNSFIGDVTQTAEMSIDVTDSSFTTTGAIGGPNESSVYRIHKTNSGTWNIQGSVNCGYFDMAGGTVNVQVGGNVQGTQLVLREANGSDTYTFTVDGGSATFTGDDHRLGHWGNHVGVLNINSGSFRADNTMTVGWDGTGKLYQTGGTASFGTLDILRTDSLIEFSGGKTTIGTLQIGIRQNGFQGAAGTVTFKGVSDVSLTDMFAYHNGTINFQDSAKVTVSNNAYFCQAANAGDIIINQSGGTFTVNGNMALGHYSYAMVTYNMTDGDLNVPNYNDNDGQTGLWFAVDGSGTLNQSGGTINVGRMNLNARDDQQVGTYVMTGGTLNVGTGGIMAIESGSGRYVIKLEKGTITAGASTLTANKGDWTSNLNMELTGTGGDRVTFKPEEGYSITLSGVLSGDGGLIKTGAGTLTLTGEQNSYSTTTISEGKLVVAGAGKLGTGAVTIADNAMLEFAPDSNQNVSNAISGAGNVVKSGEGTLTLTQAPGYTGSTTVESGTLALSEGGTLYNLSGGSVNDDGQVAKAAAVDASGKELTIDNSVMTKFVGSIKAGSIVKTGYGTLKIYADEQNKVVADKFTVSNSELDFKGYYEGNLDVINGAFFSPGNSIGEANITGNIAFITDTANSKGFAYFEFGDFTGADENHDLLVLGTGSLFNATDGVVLLDFANDDAADWASAGVDYLLVANDSFEDGKNYTSWLSPTFTDMFDLVGRTDGLYLIGLGADPTPEPGSGVPEPSTWALMVLGAAGLLYVRKRNN
ncbi:MAG: autotransporter-associated beta strand repeat-containing protein [Thermoguttaceae bacterium]|nr:autotransporter-associated beta strand repeat-containing protein [Thermoguttaceae bacterium]